MVLSDRISSALSHPAAPFTVVALALLSALILYLPSADAPFYNDDIDNLDIGSHFSPEWLNPFARTNLYFRPMRDLYWAGTYSIFGLNPVPYHIISIALHLVCTVLVFFLARPLLKTPLGAALVALLFAVSSKLSEAVQWMAAVTSLLEGFFTIATVLLFIRYLSSRRALWLVLSTAAFALALLSKEAAVILPALLWISDVFLHRKGERMRELARAKGRWKPYVPFLAVWTIYVAVYLARLGANYYIEEGRYALNANIVVKFFEFAGEVFFNWTYWNLPLALILLAIILASLVWGTRALRFGMLWFIVATLPHLPMQWQGAEERYFYVPFIGFAIFLVGASEVLFDLLGRSRRPRSRFVVACLVCAILAGYAISAQRDTLRFRKLSSDFWGELERIDTSLGEVREGDHLRVETPLHAPYVKRYLKLKRGLRSLTVTAATSAADGG